MTKKTGLMLILILLTSSSLAFAQKENADNKTTIEKVVEEQISENSFSSTKERIDLDSIEIAGYVNNSFIFRYGANNSIISLNNNKIETLPLNGSNFYNLDNNLIIIDSANKKEGYLINKANSFEKFSLPKLSQESHTSIIQKGNDIILSTIGDNKITLFKSKIDKISNWELTAQYNTSSEYDNLSIVIQNSGSDECLYLFGQKKDSITIISYNIRLKNWTKVGTYKNKEGNTLKCAKAIGASHIALLYNNNNKIDFFHTITGSFYSLKENQINNIASAKSTHIICNNEIYRITLNTESGNCSLTKISFKKIKNGFTPIDFIVIILYFAALVCIGIYFSKRQKSADDYFKGGERIPWWAAGLSLFGTALSAITFMAIPAKAFCTDWSYMLFNIGIILVAPIIIFVFIPFYRGLNITTAYQYLEVRFNSLIRMICSLAFIIFQIGRMGVVLFLPSIAINLVTGFNIFLCIGLMGIFSIIYTRMGGIEAVVWTDALQVIILLGGAIFAIFHIISSTGIGWSETFSIAAADGKFSLGNSAFDITNSSMWTVLIATFFTNLTTYGTDQSMVQRYLTTASKKAAQKSVLTNAILTIPATIIFFTIGTVLYVYYKTEPAQLSVTMENSDAIFPWYIYSNLPVGITGLLISGIFAAAMSTLSGSMNSAATAYVIDIIPKIFKNSNNNLKVAKRSTLIAGLLSLAFAFMMATWNVNSLWDEFNKILGLLLGSMGGLFLLGMLTKSANAKGALCGMIISVIVQLIVANYTPVHLLLYTTVGFITCFIVGYIASLFFTQTNE